MISFLRILVSLSILIAASGCASVTPSAPDDRFEHRPLTAGISAPAPIPARPEILAPPTDGRAGVQRHAETIAAASTPAAEDAVVDDGAPRDVTLNFDAVEIRDFARIVFEDILGRNVVISPDISGTVTLRTVRPVSEREALALVERALTVHGAVLQRSGDTFVVRRGDGRGMDGMVGPSGIGGEEGYAGPGGGADTTEVIRLAHVDAGRVITAARELQIDGLRMTATDGGRAVVVAGAPRARETLAGVVRALDTGRLAGRSFVLVPLHYADPGDISTEIDRMFAIQGDDGFRVVPVPRLDAVLLVGDDAELVAHAEGWVRRLDSTRRSAHAVHVYPVRHRRADELAGTLRRIFQSEGGDTTTGTASLTAPGFDTGRGTATPAAAISGQGIGVGGSGGNSGFGGGDFGGGGHRDAGLTERAITITADPSTNAIIVVSTPRDYRIVEKALDRLDVVPAQVLIEATIAEVTLNDTLRHGVRWFFESGNHAGLLGDENGRAIPAVLPGFNYVYDVPRARVVVDLLESLTDVEIISSPALTVLDNQTATLKVGDQVPVATRSARSVTDPDAPVVNDIELKDTGIILNVKPRINANGVVTLDIEQEISDVVTTTTSSIDSPTIRQRSISSSVVMQSGSELVLGGLISTRRERGRSGVPLLKDLPLLGNAFSSTRREGERTELLVIIRPVVLSGPGDADAVTAEIKARLRFDERLGDRAPKEGG
ncbi:type II secretion system secretin GspD (plasmid) [Tistrella mobilis]|uniref:type II secretion system secretin GspD n=1 Tax=Tistrella mobilis TaxID=171437 RepID=UPI00355713C8